MPGIQPTILIKKKDGTQVRMTMAEFDLYKKGSGETKNNEGDTKYEKYEITKLSSSEQNRAVVEEKNDSLPMVETEQHLATTAPVKEIFVDEAINKKQETRNKKQESDSNKEIKHRNIETFEQEKITDSESERMKQKDNQFAERIKELRRIKIERDKKSSGWSDDDHKSLLDEEAPDEAAIKPVVAPHAPDLEKVLTKIDFNIPSRLDGRLQSLIISFTKGVRTEEQVWDYFQKEEAGGGLGLANGQAKQLLSAIKEIFNLKNVERLNKKRSERMAALEIPAAKEEIKIPLMDARPAAPRKPQPQISSKSVFAPQASPDKPVLHDVTMPSVPAMSAPEKQGGAMGPVEELQKFSLIDFRRLNSDSNQAGELLKQKFMVLKQESHLLFMQAKNAWRQSPLYRMYQKILLDAVNAGQPVAALLPAGDGLKTVEFQVIININKDLNT